MMETELCLSLFVDTGAVLDLDFELLHEPARRFAELLDLAPRLAREVGIVWYIAHVTEHAPPEARKEVLDYVTLLHKLSRRRAGTIPPFEQSVAVLKKLKRAESRPKPKKPAAWERYLQRALGAS